MGGLPPAADAISLQAIVIMPDGDNSFYSNWVTPLPYEECQKHRPSAFGRTEKAETYCVRKPQYEDYIVHDSFAFWKQQIGRSLRFATAELKDSGY